MRPPDLKHLRLEVDRLRAAEMAPATEYGYRQDWQTFRTWCKWTGRVAMPASSETVSLFVADQLTCKKVTTVYRYCSAIAYAHMRAHLPSPADDSVRQILRGARRIRCEERRQMRPLSLAQLAEIATRLSKSHTFCAIRNCAILTVGFATGLRLSNLCALLIEDVTFHEQGLIFFVRREKQDRIGAGRSVATPYGQNELTCPVRAVHRWLHIRGKRNGALFSRLDNRGRDAILPISKQNMGKIVTRVIGSNAGEGPWGPHSLRAGLITEAGLRGVPHLVIAKHVGHKALDSTLSYFRPAQLFEKNCAGLVGV